ncbi:family 20 glycosylhydrolase [Sphingobacterium spiritivorum]|uniref:family 20 glycosylhydrolase n=1 Tax=Sphingobacterium spiritivorum TaxID=258 RepID=UPI003DA38724
MKTKLFFIACFLMLTMHTVNAQTGNNYPLSVSWQPLMNNYDGKEQALSILTLQNTSDKPFPWKGWRLYFNFIRLLEPVDSSQPLDAVHINGDYFYFLPNAKGKELQPGEKVTYTMVSKSWVVNYNDAPQGFYLRWDNAKLEPLGPVNYMRPTDEKAFFRVAGDKEMNADMLYEKNLRYQQNEVLQRGQILPTPVSMERHSGTYTLKKKLHISYDKGFQDEAELLSGTLKTYFGITAQTAVHTSSGAKDIRLLKEEGLGPEGYKLEVAAKEITVKASANAGIFYGIQSLKLLIDPANYNKGLSSKIVLPLVTVTDEPRFGSRSLMLDVARNFQPKEQILKMLDIMALYKLNTFHFHLNDDEGWRLEIPSIPELTETGAHRAHWEEGKEYNNLPPSYGSGPFADKGRGSGYYSQADFIEILQYAKRRHIKVIPEIETPGHARAAIQAMNSRYRKLLKSGDKVKAEAFLLQASGDSSVFRSVQKWNDNVMDVSMPSVYTFLEQVTDDIIAMYKMADAELETIHFGGDEVPNGVWEGSPAFAKLKQTDPAIKSTEDLWLRHFDKLYTMLKNKGLLLSGWEEVGMQKITQDGKKKWIPYKGFKDKGIHLNVWNNLGGNEDLAYRLANAGYKVKLSFVSNFYFDMAYHKDFDEQGFYWGGFIDLERPFSFVPFHYLTNQKQDWLGRPLPERVLANAEKLTPEGERNIVGLQALLWSETIKSEKEMERMLFPRLLAFSERAWAKPGVWEQDGETAASKAQYEKEVKHFFNIVGQQELKRLLHLGVEYRIPTPGVRQLENKVHVNMELPGFVIRYTENGQIPKNTDPVYSKPVAYTKGMVFRAFDERGRGGLPVSPDLTEGKHEK